MKSPFIFEIKLFGRNLNLFFFLPYLTFFKLRIAFDAVEIKLKNIFYGLYISLYGIVKYAETSFGFLI